MKVVVLLLRDSCAAILVTCVLASEALTHKRQRALTCHVRHSYVTQCRVEVDEDEEADRARRHPCVRARQFRLRGTPAASAVVHGVSYYDDLCSVHRCMCATANLLYVELGCLSDEHAIYRIALPAPGRVFADATLFWAHVAQAEFTRQYAGRCLIAKFATLGGGWACLRRADKTLPYALAMLRVAHAVFDTETERRCRLFIGWAHLWRGETQRALAIFYAEMQQARELNDVAHIRRCQHAIIHATKNPSLARERSTHALPARHHGRLSTYWNRAFC